jgi:hypothetical protein
MVSQDSRGVSDVKTDLDVSDVRALRCHDVHHVFDARDVLSVRDVGKE